ncbi:cytochrome b [Litorimonas sp.]|uniref:cytochrome b n=1 Tax=Litorimonas sp. TaxID=1892381 RepID=UPI003A8821C1
MAAQTRYSKTAIALHWTIAVLIIGLIIFGLLMTNPNMPNRFVLYQLHKSFGIMVLILSIFRLIWRLLHTPPPLPEGMKKWEVAAAKFTHIAFYVIMIGMPLLGWAMVSASPLPIPTELFWTIPWPDIPFIPESEELEDTFQFLHGNIGKLTIGLIVLHFGAAMKHHFVNKDNVFVRMFPWARERD